MIDISVERLVLAKQLDLDMKAVNGSNGANLGFETKMWTAADKLRNNMDAAEYKHVVLGLIFLKYISDSFIEVYNELKHDPENLADPARKIIN
jgi:type I restriction enzyme M protein